MQNIDDIIAMASSFGFTLSTDEAVLYRDALESQLGVFDEFVRARFDESRPPMLSPHREPGYRPTKREDPHHAWSWKCRIDGNEDGLLAGLTVGFKDHIAVAGIPLTVGARALEGFVADFDATVVTRTLAAGGSIVGKNTLNGLTGGAGWGGLGDYERPLNPHHRDHITGGSSSGSAVAVAAAEVDVSFGGDQGGSIRTPAAFCGTLGLKPTFGLLSHFGAGFGSDQSVDYVGPMARHARHLALALQATAGYDDYDPRQRRSTPESLDVLSTLEGGVRGLRLGLLEEGFAGAEPAVRDTVMAAVEVLGEQGAEITTISVPEHETAGVAQMALMLEGGKAIFDVGFFGAFARTYYPEAWIRAVNDLFDRHADGLAPRIKLGLLGAELTRRNYGGGLYARAHNVRPTFVRAFDDALARVDVLVMPTCKMTAPRYTPPAGRLEALQAGFQRMFPAPLLNTIPYNYTGHPALAVPVGKSGGLPVSMQLVGRMLDDPLLVRVAYAYEHSVDWASVIGLGDAAR